MKKLISVALCVALCFVFPVSVKANDKPEISAKAYVLYCVESGDIILSKNENERMKPASTTKLMTVLLTLEQAAKNDSIVTFTDKMQAEGSSMYLSEGDKVRLSDLAVGMMMASGNDAANAAALTIGGSFERLATHILSLQAVLTTTITTRPRTIWLCLWLRDWRTGSLQASPRARARL